MPLRLIVFLALAAGGLFFLAYLNPEPFPVALSPARTVSLSAATLVALGIVVGVVGVFLLYLYDTLAATLAGMKRSARDHRAAAVETLYREATDRLLLGETGGAATLLKRCLGHDPDHLPTLIAYGRLRREEGAVSEAVALHSRARGVDPESVAAALELSTDYVADRQFANAVAALDDVRERGRMSPALLGRMRDIYRAVGAVAEAAALQKQVVDRASWDQAPKERNLLNGLTYAVADVDACAGRIAEATAGYRATLRADPRFLPAYLKLARIQEADGRRADALKTLEKGFRQTFSPLLAKAMESLLFAAGDGGRAVAQLRWARNIAHDQPVLRLFLAHALVKTGDFSGAADELAAAGGSGVERFTYYYLLKATLAVGDSSGPTMAALEGGLNREAGRVFHYVCAVCDAVASEYDGLCPACGTWNGLTAVFF
jgi:tetratricopeptide (TPR) repeat protein